MHDNAKSTSDIIHLLIGLSFYRDAGDADVQQIGKPTADRIDIWPQTRLFAYYDYIYIAHGKTVVGDH